jgi:mycofactocin precursor
MPRIRRSIMAEFERSTVDGDGDLEERPADEDVIVDDLLIEDVSIDGMCGVY